MTERALLCPHCGWVDIDGGGSFCNGCGRPTASNVLAADADRVRRAGLVADLALLALFVVLVLFAVSTV